MTTAQHPEGRDHEGRDHEGRDHEAETQRADAKSGDRESRNPTATAPDSVHESVGEEAAYAGKSGPNAADPPRAAGKPAPAHDEVYSSDVDIDEGADAGETRAEAVDAKGTRQEDRLDENIITLDTPD